MSVSVTLKSFTSKLFYVMGKVTGYKPVCQFPFPAESVHHFWLLPRLSVIPAEIVMLGK